MARKYFITPTPSNTPSNTPEVSPSGTACPTPSPSNTATNTPTPSITASQTQTPSNTATQTQTQTQTPSQTQTQTPSQTQTQTPSQTATQTQTQTPSQTQTQTPSQTATNTSTPTMTQTPTSTSLTSCFVAMTYGTDVGFPVNKAARSTDGINWIGSNNGNSVLFDLNGNLGYGNGRFVALSRPVTGSTLWSVYSDDFGVNWNTGSTLSSTFNNTTLLEGKTIYVNGKYYTANGDIWSSTNGITWNKDVSAPAINRQYTDIASNGTRIIAVGTRSGDMVYTDNYGASWSAFTQTASTTNRSINYTNGMWLACGDVSGGRNSMNSTDGLSWTANTQIYSITSGATGLFGLGVKNNMWVLGWQATKGVSKMAYSYNGLTFTAITSPVIIQQANYIFDVLYETNYGKWLAVGRGYDSLTGDTNSYYSTDGINWSGSTNSLSVFGPGRIQTASSCAIYAPPPPSPTPTLTPSITPSNSPTPSISPTKTSTPTNTPSATPSITPTNTTTQTSTPTSTIVVSPTSSATPTITPTMATLCIDVATNMSLDITLNSMTVNGNTAYSIGGVWPNTPGNGASLLVAGTPGTYDVEIFYTSFVPGQHIEINSPLTGYACQNTTTGSGSVLFTGVGFSNLSCLQVLAADGTC